MDRERRRVARAFWTVAFVVMVTIALSACGGSEETAAPSPSPTPITLDGTTLPVPSVSGTIAFALTGGMEISDIYVVNTDGTGLKQLTDDPQEESHPSWSPDGTRILYSVGPGYVTERYAQRLWVMNADGSEKVELGGGSFAHWSPDGEHIVFVKTFPEDSSGVPADICVMNADGSDVRTLVRDAEVRADSPSWLSSERILYSAEVRSGLELFAVNLDGSDRVRLTKGLVVWDSAASPDGELVAYWIDDCIAAVPSQGGAPNVLFKPISKYISDVSGAVVAWAPDGKTFAVASSWNGSPIFIVNADGTGVSAVPGVEWATVPAWRPQ